MASQLLAAIERVYAAFGDEPAPLKLKASPYKDGPGMFRALKAAPLRELDDAAIGPYASSALLTVGSPDDYRHFLPRILELAVQGRVWTGYEPAIIAGRLSMCAWRTWPSERQGAVTAVFEAAFDAERDAEEGQAEDWLCGLAAMEEPVAMRLHGWIEGASLDGLLQLADWRASTLNLDYPSEEPLGPFWSDIDEACRSELQDILLGKRLAERLETALVPLVERYRIDAALSAGGTNIRRN